MIQHIITYLFGPYRGIDHIQTGSRYFGDATEKSDWDFVLLVNEEDTLASLASRLADLGFESCSSSKHSDDTHLIVRRLSDNVNLIVTNSPAKYSLWVKCTFISAQLKLNKEQRKVLFSELIDEKEE